MTQNKGHKFYYASKRFWDIALSILALILLSWLIILAILLVGIFSGFPIFYKDKRVGKHGKTIFVLKFRTMVKDAEEHIDYLLTEQNKGEWNSERKVKNDPRITKIGRVLRKLSIDELPQLFNVLKGDMSIVGPRPIIQREFDENFTKEEAELILSVRPGIVSYWSVHGRSNVKYAEGKRQALELSYFKHHSCFYDFWLVLSAIPVVLSTKGAE